MAEDGKAAEGGIDRRSALSLAAGWAAFIGGTAAMGAGVVRFLFPNVTFEPPQQFKGHHAFFEFAGLWCFH